MKDVPLDADASHCFVASGLSVPVDYFSSAFEVDLVRNTDNSNFLSVSSSILVAWHKQTCCLKLNIGMRFSQLGHSVNGDLAVITCESFSFEIQLFIGRMQITVLEPTGFFM